MAYAFQNPSDQSIKDYIEHAKTIAFVGLSQRKESAAYGVAKFMQAMGYQIIPVNPTCAGQEILGQVVYTGLKEVPIAIDIVDVFRPSQALLEVAYDFLETDAKVFWAQLGLQSQEAEELLRANNRHDIVMNRCIKIDYKELVL